MDIKLCGAYNTDSKTSLTLTHQNIRGLLSKNDDLIDVFISNKSSN